METAGAPTKLGAPVLFCGRLLCLAKMSFDHDAFISYAHLDNKPFPGQDRKGWVTMFGELLADCLSTRLGKEARVSIDATLKGNEVFAPEIVDRLATSALLVSILSPSYVQSHWCQREIDEFCTAAVHTGGLTLGNLSRVVKVVKLPAEPVPKPMQGMVGYQSMPTIGGFRRSCSPIPAARPANCTWPRSSGWPMTSS